MSSTTPISSKVNTNNLIPSILILSFLIVGFIQNIGAVDKIAPQWLYLSTINILSALYIFFNKQDFSERLFVSISSGISIFYIFFFIWASCSYFYAINQIEALVNITRHSNTLFMYLHLFIFIQNIKNKNVLISWVMTIFLGIEVYSVFIQALEMIDLNGVIVPGELKGVTANRNITAFSIAMKIPFLLYLFDKLKNKIFITSLIILLFFSILDLSMISSRASFVAVFLIFIGYVFVCFYKYYFFSDKYSVKKIVYKILFFLIPLIFSIIVNQFYFSSRGADAVSRAGTIAINTSDDSISKRLRYYEDVLNHMTSHPVFGTGIGNWKIESIRYDRLDIDGYIVPYHAHSDFIQLGAELGFIGFFLYLFIFITAIYYVFNILFRSNLDNDNKTFSVILLISLGVYLIDANLNFPIARPQELAPWAMVMALIGFYGSKTINISDNLKSKGILKNKKYIFSIVTLIFSLPALSISNKVYHSHKAQLIILNDFNNNTHNVPLNQIESIVPKIPNITVTTIPMDAIKARYYYHYKKYDKALAAIESSKTQNPYLSYSDALESIIYQQIGEIDKAKISAEKAYFNLPRNNFHISQYIKTIIETRDQVSLEKAFKLLTRNEEVLGWKNYMSALSSIAEPGNPKYIKRAEKAMKLFPSDGDIKILSKYVIIGKEKIEYANQIANEAAALFKNNNFVEASKYYDEAIFFDPYEYSYYENASISYYSIQDYDKSLLRINDVINKMNPLNGKCEYIKGLIYIQLGLIQDACDLFKTSLASGYSQSEGIQNQYCSN